MSELAANTPKGREYAEVRFQQAMEIMLRKTSRTWVNTQTGGDYARAALDAFIIENNEIVAGVLVSSRELSRQDLREFAEHPNRAILTYEKLTKAATISRLLVIPTYFCAYILDDRVVHLVDACDKDGNIVCDYEKDYTRTLETCNGGEADRDNAYILIVGAGEKVYRDRAERKFEQED